MGGCLRIGGILRIDCRVLVALGLDACVLYGVVLRDCFAVSSRSKRSFSPFSPSQGSVSSQRLSNVVGLDDVIIGTVSRELLHLELKTALFSQLWVSRYSMSFRNAQ